MHTKEMSGSEPLPAFSISSRLERRYFRHVKERVIEGILLAMGLVAVATTVAIVSILVYESFGFFSEVPVWDFLTGTVWSPLFENPQYGVLPLISGTLTVASIALLIALPLGTITAIYLSEFAPHSVRESVKPVLELLEAVPGVVFGYFALLLLTPLLQETVLPGLPGFNMLAPAMVIGVMIVPYVASVSEDAMRAVPMSLREGSFAMGATRFQTAIRVVTPAAVSGIVAAYVLAVSRAVGETMVVAIAAGLQPNFTFNPLDQAATMTAYIVQVSQGDLPHGTIAYQSIFAVGLTLALMTLGFNIAGHVLRRKFRENY